jgi:hypothetical protein
MARYGRGLRLEAIAKVPKTIEKGQKGDIRGIEPIGRIWDDGEWKIGYNMSYISREGDR